MREGLRGWDRVWEGRGGVKVGRRDCGGGGLGGEVRKGVVEGWYGKMEWVRSGVMRC